MAQSIKTNAIILFYNNTSGMVVFEGNGNDGKLGNLGHTWISCFQDVCWRILKEGEQVILEQ